MGYAGFDDYLGRPHWLRFSGTEEPHLWEDGSVPPPGVPTCLAQLPEEERDVDVCLKSVQIGGRNLEWVPEALKAPALCLAAVRQDAAALRFAPPELQEPLRRWLAAGLEEPPADWKPEPLEAARGALLIAAEEWKEPGGAAAEFAVQAFDGGLFGVEIRLADPEGRLYAAGAAPCVRASYRAQDGAAPDPAACLRAFAEKLAGTAGRPAEGLPAGMRKFWAAAFRLAAEAAEEAEPRNAGLRERRREAADRVRRDWTEYESLPAELRTEAVLRSAARGMAWEGLLGRPPKKAPRMEELQDAAQKACLIALESRWGVLDDLPDGLKTPDVCCEAVRKDGFALKHVPEALKTEDICLAAVLQNGRALKFAPDRLKTQELCEAAVRKDGRALEFVPRPLQTAELCMEAVRENGLALEFAPKGMLTAEFCLEAVRRNGAALKFVPGGLKTPELCMAAVKAPRQSGWHSALEFVPEELKTPEICGAAVRQNGYALEWVPDGLKTEELCMAAARQNGLALEFVPEARKTAEICLEAVRQDGYALECVPEALKTPEVCAAAVPPDRNRESARAPDEMQTADMRMAAAREWSEDYPEDLETKAACRNAVRRDAWMLAFAPGRLKTESMCLEAVRQDGRLLAHVPGWLQTEEVCMAAVQDRPRMLAWVPFWRTTPEICLEAVRRDRTALQFVPSGMHDRIAELAAEVPAPPAGPLEAACAAFAARAGKCPLPDGCSLRLEAERPGDGCVRLRIKAADPQGIAWPEGSAPSASAAYRADGGGEPDPAACLRAFAEKLAGTAGKPVETMPEGMKAFCAEAVRAAAEAAAACIPAERQDAACAPAP